MEENLMNDLMRVYQAHGYQVEVKNLEKKDDMVRLDVWSGHKYFGSQWYHKDGSAVVCHKHPF